MQDKWIKRMLGLAAHVAEWSKDPSTKVGAVIADGHNRIVSVGFNGFAKGVEDLPERLNNRELKYEMVVHAEVNAILFADCALHDCSLFVHPLPPCARCATIIIQAGIKTVYAPTIPQIADIAIIERWHASCLIAEQMFIDAKVKLEHIDVTL